MNNYIQYNFQIPGNIDKDIVIAILSDYDFEGFLETETGIVAYISQEKDNALWKDEIQELHPQITYNQEIIEPKNWNEEWEKNFDVAVINEQCEVYAPFHQVNPNILYPIFIEPKMSFGTGHHPTTNMMCNLLFELQPHLKNKRVLDVGCGTGILGIIAKKLGASIIFAIDNDAICAENTLENVQKNFSLQEISDFTVLHTDIHNFKKNHHQKFDVVLANIQKDVIQNEIAEYEQLLENGGYLLISGILKQYENEMQDYIKKLDTLTHIVTKTKDEWMAMIFQKQ